MEQSTQSLWERFPGAEESLRTAEQNHPDRTNSQHAFLLSESYGSSFTKDMVQKKRKRWRRAARERDGCSAYSAFTTNPVVAFSGGAGATATATTQDNVTPINPMSSVYLNRIAGPIVPPPPTEEAPPSAVAAHDNPGGIQTVPFREGDVAAVYNDVHVPHQDDKALSIVCAILRDLRPTHLIDAGDFLDFARLGRFPNHPQTPDVDRELALGREKKRELESAAASPALRARIKLSGNHEDRYRKYLWDMAKSLPASMVRGLHEPECLDLAGWQVYGYRQELDLDGFRIAHGNIVRKVAGWSAKAEFEARLCSGLSGHTHRAAVHRKTASGRTWEWYEAGCLCRKDMPYIGSAGADWCHAFSILRHDGGRVQVEQVLIHDYVAYFEGRKYTAGS